jgi:hypothetical protein
MAARPITAMTVAVIVGDHFLLSADPRKRAPLEDCDRAARLDHLSRKR